MDFEEFYSKQWPGMFRGSVLSAIINKHVSYIGFADRRAQGIIMTNSILVPVAIAGTQNANFLSGAYVALLTAVLSLAAAIFSLYPKRRGLQYQKTKKGKKIVDYFHFSQIQELSVEEYMKKVPKILENHSDLAAAAAYDLYYLSKFVLSPKFFWLKVSYFVFLFGSMMAVVLIVYKGGIIQVCLRNL